MTAILNPTSENLYDTFYETYDANGYLLEVKHETALATSQEEAIRDFNNCYSVAINLGQIVRLCTARIIGGFESKDGSILI
jgi:hypothetical protein